MGTNKIEKFEEKTSLEKKIEKFEKKKLFFFPICVKKGLADS